MWHVGLGPQPMHLDIICIMSLTLELGQNTYFWVNKYGGSGIMVDPSAHRLQIQLPVELEIALFVYEHFVVSPYMNKSYFYH
jgi:hypothetical protein